MTNPNRPQPPFMMGPQPKPVNTQIIITLVPPSGNLPGQMQVSTNNPNIGHLQLIEMYVALIQDNVRAMAKQQSMIIDPNKPKSAPVAIPEESGGTNGEAS